MKYLSFSFLLFLISNLAFSELLDTQKNLRTLFTSSHVRSQLDLQRQQGKFDNASQTSSMVILHKPITVKMQGVVMRKNKKPTVFVNDGNTLKSSKVNNEIIVSTKKTNKKTYKVPVRVNRKFVKLKPGQQWNESDKVVHDNYQIKPIKIKTNASDDSTEPADTLTK
ncbi:hypothetical protein MNBD_GAMMA08-2457 [hydrothermal vent metagenome]|uniref:Uncharacterized protein n=1 Tax=hydrothermal vent metagenome TaxID=652676 RepID=A0A3B0Y334_9ZZZZ